MKERRKKRRKRVVHQGKAKQSKAKHSANASATTEKSRALLHGLRRSQNLQMAAVAPCIIPILDLAEGTRRPAWADDDGHTRMHKSNFKKGGTNLSDGA